MTEAHTNAIKTDPQATKTRLPWSESFAADKSKGNPPSLRSLRLEAEMCAILRALEYTGWNRRRAAQLLCISYRGMLYKIRQHNLAPHREDKSPFPAA
jgi:DNA-binding NtrC family response regulator